MNKDLFILILKIVVAVATAILSVLGVSAFCSCTVNHDLQGTGKATIVTTDTTYIYHHGQLKTK